MTSAPRPSFRPCPMGARSSWPARSRASPGGSIRTPARSSGKPPSAPAAPLAASNGAWLPTIVGSMSRSPTPPRRPPTPSLGSTLSIRRPESSSGKTLRPMCRAVGPRAAAARPNPRRRRSFLAWCSPAVRMAGCAPIRRRLDGRFGCSIPPPTPIRPPMASAPSLAARSTTPAL